MGSSIARQGQVQPSKVASYLSAIRSWHIDHKYSLAFFETLRMKLLLQGRKSLFAATKAIRLSITQDILFTITTSSLLRIHDLNIDKAFKLAWANFMRLRELTYTERDKESTSFKDLHVMCFNITFSESDRYAT